MKKQIIIASIAAVVLSSLALASIRLNAFGKTPQLEDFVVVQFMQDGKYPAIYDKEFAQNEYVYKFSSSSRKFDIGVIPAGKFTKLKYRLRTNGSTGEWKSFPGMELYYNTGSNGDISLDSGINYFDVLVANGIKKNIYTVAVCCE